MEHHLDITAIKEVFDDPVDPLLHAGLHGGSHAKAIKILTSDFFF